jgi:alcohol dehydrogenase, propanol-preferring
MKAWHFLDSHNPLVLVDLDEPVPGEGEVVVNVRAAGLCHSDVSIMKGVLRVHTKTPIVLGHEVAGVVSQLGQGVTGVKIGDKVGLVSNRASMLSGGPIDCPGVSRDGGYATKTIGRVGFMVPIPDGVSFEQAAAGTDAGKTSYRAVKVVGDVKPGTRVGIIGLGGLGLVGARIAVILGAEVFAAELKREVWPKAMNLGVTQCFERVCELAPLKLDVIVDFAGAATTTADAIEAVRPEGRVVQVGQASREATISLHSLTLKAVHLVGSLGGTGEDIAAVYDLIARGQLSPTISVISFDAIPEGLERLRSGTVEGRLVARVSG